MADKSFRRCKYCYRHYNRSDYGSDRGFNTAVQAHEHRCASNPAHIDLHPNFLAAKRNKRIPRAVVPVKVKAAVVDGPNGIHQRRAHFRMARKAAAGGYVHKFCPYCPGKTDLEALGNSAKHRFVNCPECGDKLP